MHFEKLRSYFFLDFKFKIASLWFKRLLYAYLILRCLQWLSLFEYLFGEQSMVLTQFHSIGIIRNLAFLLYQISSPAYSLAAILIVMLVCIVRFFSIRYTYFFDALLWFLILNIHNKIYPCLTGGDMLLNQFLFFNIFITTKAPKGHEYLTQFKTAFHNLGVTAILLQVCMLYFMAGLAKLGDSEWVEGHAIITISQVRHFSNFPNNYIEGLNLFYVFLNYLVVLYQLLFPLLVWLNRIKKPLLLIGILMHAYIGFFMGLPEFSAVMVIAYVFFWPHKSTLT